MEVGCRLDLGQIMGYTN